ncbi:unnamed protein product, partial [Symbiodinium sp. CCMP2592]
MDTTAPTNPAGVPISELGDDDTESARSRSNLGAELPVVTAREGRVALTEQTLRSHVGSLGPQPAYVPSRASLTHQPSPTVVGYSPVPPSHTSVPTVVNQLYQHQQNVLISADPALIMDTANARHAEAVRNIQSENREQILALETGAMSQVAQLRLEHAQLQSKARAFEEQANQNIHAGRQAVAQYQIEAEAAAAEAEQLRQRLLSAEQTAANVVAQVETEANRRLQANQADVSARDNELSRLKGEMQEMMRIQALNMEMLQKDNAELRTRLAEAKADPLGNEPEQAGPPGLGPIPINTPPGEPLEAPEKSGSGHDDEDDMDYLNRILEEEGSDLEDMPKDDPGAARASDGAAVAPDGESEGDGKKRKRGIEPRKALYQPREAEASAYGLGHHRCTHLTDVGKPDVVHELWDDNGNRAKRGELWTGTTYICSGSHDRASAMAAVQRVRDKNEAKKEAKKQAFYDINQLGDNQGCMYKKVREVIYDMSSFLQQAIDKYKQLAGP